MITHFRIENFKCIADTGKLPLGRVNVFIGGNDSGKSSLLQAFEVLASVTNNIFGKSLIGTPASFTELCRDGDTDRGMVFQSWHDMQAFDHPGKPWRYCIKIVGTDSKHPKMASEVLENAPVTFRFPPKFEHEDEDYLLDHEKLAAIFSGHHRKRNEDRLEYMAANFRSDNSTLLNCTGGEHEGIKPVRALNQLLGSFQYYRFDPAMLNNASRARDDSSETILGKNGSGLPTALSYLGRHSPEDLIAINQQLQRAFPAIERVQVDYKSIDLKQVFHPGHDDQIGTAPHNVMRFVLSGSKQEVSANQVSDGALYYLAFLVLLHLRKRPYLLAIEEPENGVHPKRLEEIVGLIRRLADPDRTPNAPQVIITTHSPYLLDHFKPEEVFAFSRKGREPTEIVWLGDEEKVKNTKDRLEGFDLGEYWAHVGEAGLLGKL